MSQPPDNQRNENDDRDSEARHDAGSTPDENRDTAGEGGAPENGAEQEPRRGGIRDEIEEILRDQGEEPVLPRRPRMRGSRPFSNMGGLMARRNGPETSNNEGGASFSRVFMNTTVYLLLLRMALGLAVGFIAFRILGPRAILLVIVIALAVAAVSTARLIMQRSRN